MWHSYGSSYNKWMKKSALLPFAAAWKTDEKEKPLHQHVACSPQQVDEKGLLFIPFCCCLEKGMKKNEKTPFHHQYVCQL
jgi:hypothetical protein